MEPAYLFIISLAVLIIVMIHINMNPPFHGLLEYEQQQCCQQRNYQEQFDTSSFQQQPAPGLANVSSVNIGIQSYFDK